MIDYSSEVEYRYDLSEIKVPPNLLKDEDTKIAFQVAEKMENDLTRYSEFKNRRKENEGEHFVGILEANDRMITISYIELALIVCVGVYQFFMIRKFLVDKQYM